MFRSIIWLLAATISLIILLPVGLIIKLLEPKSRFAPINGLARLICKNIVPIACRLAGCDFEIIGSENLPDCPAIYTGNHQGDLDVLLVLFALGEPKIIIAKKEAQKVPIAHLWMTILKCIFIDRKDLRQSLKCIKLAEKHIQNGQSVLVFPEGTRSKGPQMNPFKRGAYKIALETDTPVVPFAIDGTYKVFERQRYLKKAKVTFSILPPIMPIKGEKSHELAARVQDVVEKELERLRDE